MGSRQPGPEGGDCLGPRGRGNRARGGERVENGGGDDGISGGMMVMLGVDCGGLVVVVLAGE